MLHTCARRGEYVGTNCCLEMQILEGKILMLQNVLLAPPCAFFFKFVFLNSSAYLTCTKCSTMKFLLALSCFLAIAQSSHSSYARPVTVTDAKVYIGVSSGAKVYHKIKDCRGLHACTHTIKKVTEKEARNDDARRACKVCY